MSEPGALRSSDVRCTRLFTEVAMKALISTLARPD
jgi:hypothetical protein